MQYTVKELAEKLRVTEHTILCWIHNRELLATNVNRVVGRKPRWRISEEALKAFEESRSPSPPAPAKRRARQPAEVIDFYK